MERSLRIWPKIKNPYGTRVATRVLLDLWKLLRIVRIQLNSIIFNENTINLIRIQLNSLRIQLKSIEFNNNLIEFDKNSIELNKNLIEINCFL